MRPTQSSSEPTSVSHRKGLLLASVISLISVVASVLVPTTAAFAADPAAVRNIKSADATLVHPGDTFNWKIEVGCSVLTDDCVNAKLTDVVPPEFILPPASGVLFTPALDPAEHTVTISGQTVTVDFQQPLDNPTGEFGLRNMIISVSIPVTVRSDLDYTPTPRTVENTSHMVADNAPAVDSTASVQLEVPLELAADSVKSFTPSSNLSIQGLQTDLGLTGTNTSNAPVNTLTIQDPVDPTAAGNIFQSTLEVTSLDSVSWPTGATSAELSVWDASIPGWVSAPSVSVGNPLSLPSGVTLSNIQGIKVVFDSGSTALIPRNTQAELHLTLANRAGVTSGPHSNTVQTTVGRDALSAQDQSTATYQVVEATSSVAATKSIDPERLSTVALGGSDLTHGLVTLTGKNSGTVDLKSLTISEPSNPSDLSSSNPLAPAHTGGGLIFDGFTGGVTWPTGATTGTITYYYSDGTNQSLSAVAPGLPSPDPLKRVTGFAVNFTGTFAPDDTATLPFSVRANPLQVAPLLSELYTNQIQVDGVDVYNQNVPPASATDTVTVLADQVNLSTKKDLTHTQLYAQEGQSTTATLTTTVADYPDTTRTLAQIEMFDPATQTGMTEWYEYFNATGLVFTQVPSDATLTVSYRDSLGNYTTLTVLGPGTNNYSIPSGIRDSIYGLKLTWDSTTGFQPGQSLVANVNYSLRGTLRDSATPLPNAANTIENCSASSGKSTNSPDTLTSNTATSDPCPTVDLIPVPTGSGAGTSDLLEKEFLNVADSNPQDLIYTRNDNQTRARLSWSTNGFTNINQMVIYDGPTDGSGNPDPTAVALGMYDAFNLVQVRAINSSLDPLMTFDKVYAEFYDSSSNTWVSNSYCPQSSPCDGSAPTYNLTTTEQQNFTAVRFVFSEGSNRTGISPAPGSGVADSISHNRHIDLVYQLRNNLRVSPNWPVVDGYQYNAAVTGSGHSVVRNDAWSQATTSTGSTLVDRANDSIELRDPVLALSVSKTWTGGDVPIVSGGGPQPTTRVTLRSRNQTVGAVNSMTISEPNSGSTLPTDSPFEQFNLFRFQSVQHPIGATGLTVTVVRTSGGNLVATGTPNAVRTTVLAWTSAQLANATSFSFVYTGRLSQSQANSNDAVITFDLELRTATRTSAIPLTSGTVYNSTNSVISDPRWDSSSTITAPTFTDSTLEGVSGANINLVAANIGITTSKSFAKTSEMEPARSQFNLTLSATSNGSERVKQITITDDRATFWNSFDFVANPANSPTLPAFSPNPTGADTVIQVEACVGGTWSASAIAINPDQTCTERGGTWVGAGTWKTQTQARAAFLPTGVVASDVQGLRLTIKRANDSQWENPNHPAFNIPVTIQRRTTLRTGGDVLTDYTGNAPAPGETVAGRTTNGIDSRVDGIWGGSATASNTATYNYLHATVGVRVEKSPAGIKAPGSLFNYTLQVTNTGTFPIQNPVITDYLPTDGTGAMLIFDPDNPWTYNYQLTGAPPSPANGTALPSGTSGPTVNTTQDSYGPTQIQFTFPTGSVLEVGQIYTITIPMEFRPGLVNNVDVTNSFSIRGDRQFDTCTAPAGKTATYNAATGECTTSTTVKPSEQPALRAFMKVKADLDGSYPTDMGFTGPSNCAALKDADGFSKLPCIPRTLPGQSETWRLFAQNIGTTYMPRLVLASRLPEVSDKTILDQFVRNSRWDAGFADEVIANLGVPGATLTTYYTTAAAPCKLVLQNPSNLNACGNDPATGWAPWTPGTLVDPTIVTGLQFVVDFPSTHLWAPGESLTIDVKTRTAALSSTPGANTTAQNSLSASAISRIGVVDSNVTALDYSVVSVALATGSVLLSKQITGPGASFIPNGQTFTGQLVCTSLGQQATYPFTLTADTSTSPITVTTHQFDDLPGGATCTVTETNASGQTSYSATTVTVNPLADPTSLPGVELTNDYQLAGIQVSKTVTTTATVIPVDFSFTLSCTFLGQAVPLAVADAAFTLDNGESKTVTGIPANADCVLTETDPKGADATIMSATTDTTNAGSAVVVDNTARTATFTRLSPNSISGVTNTANANNRFDAPAALVVTKHLEGGGAAQFGSTKTFTVHVLCTFGATTQYDGDVQLNAGNAWQAVLENIISGSSCTFTESGLQGADAVEITPNDGTDLTTGVVTVPDPTVADPSPVVDIAVNNWYLTGSVQVTKTFVGDQGAIDKFARDPIPAIEFQFELNCTRGGENVTIPGGNTRTVTAASPVANYTGIASGADCVLTEPENGGSSQTRILDELGVEIPGGAFTITVDPTILSATDQAQGDVTVENRFRFASVSASKSVDGVNNYLDPFELTLNCTLDGRAISALEPAAATIYAGQTVTWTELAEGADCNLTETVTGGAKLITTALTAADGSVTSPVIGSSVSFGPIRWTGDPAPNAIYVVNSFRLANTGVGQNAVGALGMAGGLFFGGLGLALFGYLRRRRATRVRRAH
ncbi:MAG: hypothetical protein KF844_00010 [Cryobacterium sp.]|nr:hypothetical protein [Cryobacterium sp.]